MSRLALENQNQRAGVREVFALHRGNGLGQAGLQLRVQLLPARLDIENLGQLGNAFVETVNAETAAGGCRRPHQVVLGFAVRGHEIGWNLQARETARG